MTESRKRIFHDCCKSSKVLGTPRGYRNVSETASLQAVPCRFHDIALTKAMHQQDENLLAVLDLVLLGPIVPQVRT